MSYVVIFAAPTGSEPRHANTAFLDRAVDHLLTGSAVEIRHSRRSGALTLTIDRSVLLTGADPRAVRQWLRDAEQAGVTIVTDARSDGPQLHKPPVRPSRSRRNTEGQDKPPPPPSPPTGQTYRSAYGRGGTVVLPRRRFAVDDEASYESAG